MKQKTKQILALALALLTGFVVYVALHRPSASHQGYYVEKHLWGHTSPVTGEEEVDETLKFWGKYNISNPTRHSIWIQTYVRKGAWGEPICQYRLAPGSDRAKTEGTSWRLVSGGCGYGPKIEEIEIPASSTRTVMLEGTTAPKCDLTGIRILYSTSPRQATRGKSQETSDSILRKFGFLSIPVPLQTLLRKYPDVMELGVDRVVNNRIPPSESSENDEPEEE